MSGYDVPRAAEALSTNARIALAELASMQRTLPLVTPASFDRIDWILQSTPEQIADAHVAVVVLKP